LGGVALALLAAAAAAAAELGAGALGLAAKKDAIDFCLMPPPADAGVVAALFLPIAAQRLVLVVEGLCCVCPLS
jgi:hypothetical protein